MNTTTFAQPQNQLGQEIAQILAAAPPCRRVILVSAFTALRTVLRLRESLLAVRDAGGAVRMVLGVDLGGTSREVLTELSGWNCDVFVYHNPIVRATFHPKVYLFERDDTATLFVGSNNLTDGGLFTNYEATTRYTFTLPGDSAQYGALLAPLQQFLEPAGPTVCRLDANLIQTLVARNMLPTEESARRSRRADQEGDPAARTQMPPSPFSPAPVPWPPLLPRKERANERRLRAARPPARRRGPARAARIPDGVLVWRKVLPRTDALQVRPGSHHVGGVRLTQASFENPPGQIIDQTTYFRRLFDDYDWEHETGGHGDQEHAFIPMRIVLLGTDHGVRNFEVSHKPSGEAGQANYTTILRWGRDFNAVVQEAHLTDKVFSLYETSAEDAGFMITVTEPE